MTIATEKLKPKSERFMLIRMEPARDVTSTLAAGGGLYSCAMPFKPSRVQRNGVNLTEDNSDPTVNDHWYWDGTTLKVKLASAPSTSTPNVIVAFYYIYLTGNRSRYANSTPTDTNAPLVQWVGRITSYPSTSQSIANIYSGVFSIDGMSISAANPDNYFGQYLTPSDSFYKKRVDAWVCINSVSNIETAYRGVVASIFADNEQINFSVLDDFNRLNSPAYMGDTSQESIFIKESGSYPSIYRQHAGKPNRFIASDVSKYDLNKSQELTLTLFGAPFEKFQFPDWRQYMAAVNTDYDATALSEKNEWALCRLGGTALQQSFGSTVNVVTDGFAYYLGFSVAPSNVFVGASVTWVNSPNTYKGIVVWVGSRTYLGNTYHIAVIPQSSPFVLNTSSVFNNLSAVEIIVDVGYTSLGSNVPIQTYEGLDYTLNQTTTSGGNKSLSVSFVPGLNGRYPGYGTFTLNPESCTVHYRVFGPTNYGHGQLLKSFCDKVGIETDAASFTSADAALTDKVAISIPYHDEESYGTYVDYAERILASTLGYLSIDADFKVKYSLTVAPTSGDGASKTNIERDSFAWNCEYQDLVSRIIASNQNYPIGNSSYDVVNYVAKYLHGIDDVYHFEHALKTLSQINNILKVRSNRRLSYTFTTATANIDSAIGDNLTLTYDKLPGSVSSDNVKIVSLEKEADKTSVTALDFEGL